jgi:hypothetical protein
MNRFFQALVSRYLHDHLQEYDVEDAHRLNSLFCYALTYTLRLCRTLPIECPHAKEYSSIT